MSNRKIIISAIFAIASVYAFAQSSTNSPYTRFGFGDLSDQIFTSNAAMGGVGHALRSSRHINTMNPASYTSVDSLSFMFDIGFSMKSSNYEENGIKSNARNSSFDYLAIQFRLHPRLGMAIGFTPFSTVGYNFSNSNYVSNSNTVSVTNSYTGDGGTNVVFAGHANACIFFQTTKHRPFLPLPSGQWLPSRKRRQPGTATTKVSIPG